MPEKTALKVNNYGVMPVSAILSFATVIMLILKSLNIITVSWFIVFSPIAIWLGVVISAGIVFVGVISLVALLQVRK